MKENYDGYKFAIKAEEQIEKYSQFENIKDIQGLRKYTVVAVNDKIFVDEIV